MTLVVKEFRMDIVYLALAALCWGLAGALAVGCAHLHAAGGRR